MDKIPKFRRKPKHPTIETAVERSSSDTFDSIASNEVHSQQPLKPSPAKPSKRAAIRNFRLRTSGKRARDSSPAEFPSSPPPAAVVTFDGIKSRPVTAEGDAIANCGGRRPRMPAFLDLSNQELDFRYQELMWAERDRVLEASRNEAVDDFRWGQFKQVDAEEKGLMDRYFNIRPWNHNRIKLRVPETELDYVNASAMSLPSPSDPGKQPLTYIAMQGPTEPSFDYVWRMISEQLSSPAVIVQLTCMNENGAIKCHQYFPNSDERATWALNETNTWGDDWQASLTYESLEESAGGAIEKRKLLLHVGGESEPRVVWHLLYSVWPDFGVPELEELDSFFELMRLSRKCSAPSNPRIIHCSAGVGRTGTFIALEHLIRELDSGALKNYDSPVEGPDLVYETVDLLREQRVGMVQGRPQYAFIYQVLRKLWQEKYGVDEECEPAAKRLEVDEAFLEAGPGPDVAEVGIAR